MELIMAFTFVTLFALVVCLICYKLTTDSVIKEQEKEIARLNNDLFRLKAARRKLSRRQAPQVIEIHDNTVDPENVPDYKPF